MALPMRIQHIGVIALALAAQGCTGFEIHANTKLGPVERKPEQKEAVDDAPPPPPDESNVAEIVVEPDGRVGACLVPVVIERSGHPVVQDPAAPVCAPGEGR